MRPGVALAGVQSLSATLDYPASHYTQERRADPYASVNFVIDAVKYMAKVPKGQIYIILNLDFVCGLVGGGAKPYFRT